MDNEKSYDPLVKYLNDNGYHTEYIHGDHTIKITNLDLDYYDNIEYIDVSYGSIYGVEVSMYIAIKKGFIEKKNYGFNDNFDLLGYKYYDLADEHDYLIKDMSSNDELLQELDIFGGNSENIKGE